MAFTHSKRPLRFSFVFLFLLVCLLGFIVKLILIQTFRSSYLADLAEKQHNHYIELEPRRGMIYDRRLRPLAFNAPAFSLYANPRSMNADQKKDAVEQLAPILKKDAAVLEKQLNKNKYFVWLKRKLPAAQMEIIKALKLRGLAFLKESIRRYPNEFLAAHVIGFTGIDNQGLEGLEMVYDESLKGQKGWSRMLRDAKQRDLLITKEFIPPQDGFHLVLTIDETIQYIAERALDKAYKHHNAKAASIVVMNPQTGEILALANRPTFDLNHLSKSTVASRTNQSVAYTYEPGSVFKIVTAAAALEEGVFHEEDKIFCENGKYKIGNHILKDHRPHGTLTFQEVFEKSSNIGVAKIAQRLGPEQVYRYARRFRFGLKTNINLPGEVSGWLKPTSQWSKTSIGAIPMGHEVTATPLQLVSAISVIANQGVYMKPFVIKSIKDSNDQVIREFHPEIVDRVIPEDIALRVQKILTGVVERGTGRRAGIKGVSVAGKTGTAQKVVDGAYSHKKFYASFIGFAPADNPKLAVVVVFNEPYPSYYGGTVAAPVFQEVVEDSLKYIESVN